jgi:DNA-binding NarL/FixJ family response regulator
MAAEAVRRAPATVLLVDDSDILRVTVRARTDADDRFEVIGEANNGELAVELTRTLHPDVIVLDHQMPVRTGLDCLPDLRAAAPSAVIVVYSSDDDSALRRIAMDRGASAYLVKGRDTLDDVLDIIMRIRGWMG